MSYIGVEEVVDHDHLLLVVVLKANSTIVVADQRSHNYTESTHTEMKHRVCVLAPRT
jgi:hypothetical protein